MIVKYSKKNNPQGGLHRVLRQVKMAGWVFLTH